MPTKLKAFAVDHSGNWLGGVSIAIAVDEADARRLVLAELTANAMPHEEIFTVTEIDLTRPHARILDNGEY